MPNFLVNTDTKLQNIMNDLHKSSVIGLDTEFIRESSYFPKLALLQIATTGNIYCIDVINIQNDAHLKDIFINKDDEIISKIKNAEIVDLKTISAFNVFDNYFKNDLPEFNK